MLHSLASENDRRFRKRTVLGTESAKRDSGFTLDYLPHFQAAYPDKKLTEDDLFYYIYGCCIRRIAEHAMPTI